MIVGCGISGIVLAERIASVLKEPVTIIDSRNHIGGNCYDYKDSNGIFVHKYGPHIFHTSDREVWDYISLFTNWQPFFLKIRTTIKGKEVPFPFNFNSIKESFDTDISNRIIQKLMNLYGYGSNISLLKLKESRDSDLKFLVDYIYENNFINYYKKQWGLKPEELNPSVADRVPVAISENNNYFSNLYQGMPDRGFSHMFSKMLNNPLITIQLNTKFNSETHKAANIYYTGSIDEFFNYRLGFLPYRSIRFDIQKINKPYYQDNVVITYPNEYAYTRVTDYKYFVNHRTDSTVISFEYPEAFIDGQNDRYYPILQKQNEDLYNKYLEEAKKLGNIYFFGRLGDYKYYDMDLAVKRALNLFKQLFYKNA